MPKLQVILGSTRPTRAADRVVPWVVDRAESHGAFEVELLDLRDWPLPFFQEHIGTLGDFSDPTYSDPIVRSWNRKIAEGDASSSSRLSTTTASLASSRTQSTASSSALASATNRSRSSDTAAGSPRARGLSSTWR
jgi:NADPH-dependent FMN reductase